MGVSIYWGSLYEGCVGFGSMFWVVVKELELATITHIPDALLYIHVMAI